MKFNFSGIVKILIIVLIIAWVVKKIYLSPRQNAGDIAPDFTTSLINNETFSLSELQGHYVLLDFWASWCGPCRKENPSLVELFHTYKDQSFKGASSFFIVSIGLERNKEKWLQAIRTDRLRWPYHIYQENDFDSPIAELYKVKEIPRKYLINPEGMIVLVNPTVQEIHDYLSNQTQTAPYN
jgi:thiol-disulfide isomerase/thioredoxin